MNLDDCQAQWWSARSLFRGYFPRIHLGLGFNVPCCLKTPRTESFKAKTGNKEPHVDCSLQRDPNRHRPHHFSQTPRPCAGTGSEAVEQHRSSIDTAYSIYLSAFSIVYSFSVSPIMSLPGLVSGKRNEMPLLQLASAIAPDSYPALREAAASSVSIVKAISVCFKAKHDNACLCIPLILPRISH